MIFDDMPVASEQKSPTMAADAYSQERVTDLLVRFWGLGRTLSYSEKDILLVALDEENKFLQGPIHMRALRRLKEKGIE